MTHAEWHDDSLCLYKSRLGWHTQGEGPLGGNSSKGQIQSYWIEVVVEKKVQEQRFSKENDLDRKSLRRGVVVVKAHTWVRCIVSVGQPCYIMDGMGECECCIRQGGLQGRAHTEDTPEASSFMPDMLLRLQGLS